jgi:hypothetical protein
MNVSKLIKLFDGHMLKWPRYYGMVNNQVHHQAYTMIHYQTLINYDKLSCLKTKVETIFDSSYMR